MQLSHDAAGGVILMMKSMFCRIFYEVKLLSFLMKFDVEILIFLRCENLDSLYDAEIVILFIFSCKSDL